MNVLLIGDDGEKIGNVSIEEARKISEQRGKDLVMVSPNVYKIIDSGKLKYEQKQKEKSQRAQKRTHKIKEIKFRLVTDKHDIDIKTKRIREFLKQGLRTKITMQFKGRQQSFQNVGFEKIKEIIAASIEGGIASVGKGPIFEGSSIVVFLIPTK